MIDHFRNPQKQNKIAMLLPNLRGDGAVRMMLLLADGFAQNGYHVDLLVARCAGESTAHIPSNVRLVDLQAPRSMLAVPAIVRYLRQYRPKILFATEHYSGLPALYSILIARTSTRCIIRQDNTWSMDVARASGRHRWLTPLMARLLFPKAHLIAVSNGVAADLIKHLPIPSERVKVIYNPVIDKHLALLAKQPTNHPWLDKADIPVVMAVGRLAPAKGFDILITAFAKLTPRIRARLLILGEGPERAHLESLISSLNLGDSCQLLGYEANPYRFLSKANAFALSSRFEGLPTVLIEALSLKIPVVSTDCPSGPREILDNGRFGRLVRPEDSDALCEALFDVLSSAPSHDEGLEAWLQQFTFEKSISAHIKFAEDVAAMS